MTHFIYRLTSPSQKVYIGQALNFERRMWDHANAASRQIKSYLYDAVRKYGWEAFKKEIIEVVESKDEANAREVYWIEYHQSFLDATKGYNCSAGGTGGNTFGKKSKEEMIAICERKRTSMLGKNKGKVHTEESKIKIRNKRALQTFSEENLKKRSDKMKGRVKTEEHKRKIQESVKRNWELRKSRKEN